MNGPQFLTYALRRRGFRALVGAQFLSALADNALLIAAIGLLMARHAPAWMTPALRLFFYLSFVLLAVLAGAAADAWPKGRVLVATNLAKAGGAALLLLAVHPLLAYALIGIGAAAGSPAKYGILPELLAPGELVRANAWIEVSTVAAILLGVGLGSLLMDPAVAIPQPSASRPVSAIAWIGVLYIVATLITLLIPRLAASNPRALARPALLLRDFAHAMTVLWRDPAGRISMAVTSLFWAVAATLQFIVLRWAAEILHLPLAQGALLQGAVAVGMIAGACAAGRWVGLEGALRVLPLGLALGAALLLLTTVIHVVTATLLLGAIGMLSGLFLVPMNALLQHRGKTLMHPGQSVAVQNFNENLASLVLLAVYGALVACEVPLLPTIVAFGALVIIIMLLIIATNATSATDAGKPLCGAAQTPGR